ncbi:hypothetical protein AXK57_08435 [Tsukamurella pulmonis]|nr:hypothetical protein AXK57_08435 [Tsukamurella pulmonis]RDH10595.1 hypothetical protein DVB88_17085 [Tsukamurella pulmonis]
MNAREWWRRYQWAAEQVNQRDSIAAQEFGRAVMYALAAAPDLTASELAILQAVAERAPVDHNGVQSADHAA